MHFDGLELQPPANFETEETILSLRAPPGPSDPRLLQKQIPVRANLIVSRKRVGPLATLPLLVAEVSAELVSTVVGLRGIANEEIRFADGVVGVIVSFEFPMREVAAARQFHALRLDDGIFTDLTLTVDGLTLNDSAKKEWLEVLVSARKEQLR
ncbi:MAG: hypothetical protein HYV07_00360 [Deltaproteobacteria bacterium]|nr:hypothetical protein [Deltaproteobacteria bacterium]